MPSAIKLPNSPAFGFEIPFKHHALIARVEMWETRSIRAFGICLPDLAAKNIGEIVGAVIGVGGTIAIAISKILGYLPIIGVVVGFKRIEDVAFWAIADGVVGTCLDDGKTTLQNKKWHIIRGIGEAAGLGVFWLGLDVANTLARSKWTCQEDVKKHSWLSL